MYLYNAYHLRKTSNALVTLVKAKRDCLKELPKTIKTTRRICEFVW